MLKNLKDKLLQKCSDIKEQIDSDKAMLEMYNSQFAFFTYSIIGFYLNPKSRRDEIRELCNSPENLGKYI